MTSHNRMITKLRSFSFGFCINHSIWSFLDNTSLWDRCLKFLIFQQWELVFGFFSNIHFNTKVALPFPSQILVCATSFCSSISLFHFEIYIWWALLQKYKNKNGKLYRNKSMQVSRPTRLLTNHSWQAWRSIYNNHT